MLLLKLFLLVRDNLFDFFKVFSILINVLVMLLDISGNDYSTNDVRDSTPTT
jgi:hypothetical protein